MAGRIADVLRTNPRVRLVARETKVANDQLELGKPSVLERFPLILDLHPFTKGVADQTNVVAFLQLEIGGKERSGNEQADQDRRGGMANYPGAWFHRLSDHLSVGKSVGVHQQRLDLRNAR